MRHVVNAYQVVVVLKVIEQAVVNALAHKALEMAFLAMSNQFLFREVGSIAIFADRVWLQVYTCISSGHVRLQLVLRVQYLF